MDQQYSDEYKGPEGDPGADLDFDLDDEDFEDENGDLMRIVGIAGGVAALVGAIMILMGRRQQTPTERLTKEAGATGKDLRKAVEKADLAGLLSDARDQANARLRDGSLRDLARSAGKGASQATQAAGNVDLQAAMDEIGRRLATIEREGRRGARKAQKEAKHALSDLDLSNVPDDVSNQLSALWDGVTKRAKDVGWQEAIAEASTQVRRLSRQARGSNKSLDISGLADLLDGVKQALGDASDRVQKDVLPNVQGTLSDDLLPEARKRARQAGEALSSIADEARKRGGQLADNYAPDMTKQAGKAAERAGGWKDQAADVLRVLALEAVNRMMSDVLPGAKKGGGRVAETVLEDTFPWLRHRAGEVRDRVKDDVAPRVQALAADAPSKVRGAVDTAGPVVADTLGSAAGAVGDTLGSAAGAVGDVVGRVRPKVSDAAGSGRDAVRNGGSGVGGALSSVRQRAGEAVGNTVDTTKYVTGESSRILFWLSMLSGLILLVFVPDAEKQKELWGNLQEFLGELRSMWGDFSEDPAATTDYTGDAGV